MDEEAGETPISWLILLAIGLTATIAAGLSTTSTLLLVPYLCVAALSLSLPRRQFLFLTALLACAISIPLLANLPVLANTNDQAQITHRSVALVCLLIIVASRMYPSAFPWIQVDRNREPGFDSTAVRTPKTRIHDTKRRDRENPEGAFSVDGLAPDSVAPALERLESSGKFDEPQLKLIESEMRMLEGHHIGSHYASSLPKGAQVGRFVIDEPLGRGGEGNVYRAHDAGGELAAIKILHNMRVSDRFRREMHMVRQLAHPNIVTAYEVGEYRGLPFITMELLRGPDLNALVHDSGPLNWMDSTQYILQATRALAHAHRRDLIHRDIKPGNIILNGSVVKLVDLGLASMCGNDRSVDSIFQFETQEGHLAGTLPYMAPEQARSLANATVQSDIYGVGATWFYLLTGAVRLRGKTFSQQFENLLVRRRFNSLPDECLPTSLREIYQRMVAYDADTRYDNCEQLSEEIEQALETAGESVCVEDINVLVVEDSRTDMLFTIEMLRRSNPTLSIQTAKTLAEGTDICRQMSIDLVLLDLTLPDSAGVETVARFRAMSPDVPLVVLTGLTQDEAGAQCLAAGADAFITKNGLTPHRMERTIFVTLSRCGMTRNAKI